MKVDELAARDTGWTMLLKKVQSLQAWAAEYDDADHAETAAWWATSSPPGSLGPPQTPS